MNCIYIEIYIYKNNPKTIIIKRKIQRIKTIKKISEGKK